jgi:hypothetical protein
MENTTTTTTTAAAGTPGKSWPAAASTMPGRCPYCTGTGEAHYLTCRAVNLRRGYQPSHDAPGQAPRRY